MATMTIPEAKADFDALIDRVERGEDVTITRGGRMVARLTSPEGNLASLDRQRRSMEAFARMQACRAEVTRDNEDRPVTIDDILAWRDDGRR